MRVRVRRHDGHAAAGAGRLARALQPAALGRAAALPRAAAAAAARRQRLAPAA